jgi:hypothetical protein
VTVDDYEVCSRHAPLYGQVVAGREPLPRGKCNLGHGEIMLLCAFLFPDQRHSRYERLVNQSPFLAFAARVFTHATAFGRTPALPYYVGLKKAKGHAL